MSAAYCICCKTCEERLEVTQSIYYLFESAVWPLPQFLFKHQGEDHALVYTHTDDPLIEDFSTFSPEDDPDGEIDVANISLNYPERAD